jgi:DNA-binding MarR family transcriptional regulator
VATDAVSATDPVDAAHQQVDYPNRELMETAARFAGAFHRWLGMIASDGLTYPRLRVLEELHCRGPAKLKSLADLLGMSARNLTVLADGLETDGLARRVDHPTDRRVTLLELTPAGQDAADEALAPRLARMSQLFDRLTPPQRRQLDHMLRVLIEAMEEIEADS